MATTERREVYTTRVVRSATGHPTEANFDSNLDNLLEDLQSSVARPAVGGGRVQQVIAANPATVLDGTSSVQTVRHNYVYNVSGIQQGAGGDHNRLDSLLDDLHHITASNTATSSTAAASSSSSARHAQETHKRSVQRELVYDTDRSDISATGSLARNADAQALHQETRRVQREVVDVVDGVQVSPVTTDVVRAPADINPDILAQLEPSLLPPPNTRVTTTIKTYTYEIPAGGYPVAASPKPLHADTSYESAGDTSSHSFVYSGQREQRARTPLSTQHANYSSSETVTSKSSRYGDQALVARRQQPTPPPPDANASPPGWKSNVHKYSEHTTSNARSVEHTQPPPPTAQSTVSYKYSSEHHSMSDSGQRHPTDVVPRHPPLDQGGRYPPGEQSARYPPGEQSARYPPRADYPDGPHPRDVNITYKYTSTHTASNSLRGREPSEVEPLLQPPPFPTDSPSNRDVPGPPKQLDQLMAEIGREPPASAYNAGYTAHEESVRREETMRREQARDASRQVTVRTDAAPTKNVAGPPVYYPPGHEMFAHKEEAAAAGGGGGMMRESAKYKYEAKSSSKSKSSGGVAVVPVCLPLCCGLPCVIM